MGASAEEAALEDGWSSALNCMGYAVRRESTGRKASGDAAEASG